MAAEFFDSNVLLYLASGDPRRADQAEAAIGQGGFISVQVLNELANVARRKMSMSWAEVAEFLSNLRGILTVHPLTVEIHNAALELAERYGLGFHNAVIAASALDAGCDTLWSADFQDRMIIGQKLRVMNPFRQV
jgi:predicted nucleic acid-binding protein